MINIILNYIRPFLFILFSIIGLYLLSKLFGHHFLKVIFEGAKREFSSRMGLVSLLGFLAFLYFALEKSIFEHLVIYFSPNNFNHGTNNTIIWALVIVLLGNFVLIGILSIHNKK